MSELHCRLLQWDTEFFGFRIARVSKLHLACEDMRTVLDWCAREHIRCLYLLAASDDSTTIQLAENHDFHLADIRVTLERPIATALQQSSGIRLAREGDIPALVSIARASHTDSRFYFDTGFPRERSDALYEAWIENSCHGYAQTVLVAERHTKLAGYITCHRQQREGQIGLLAVADWARGTGVATSLIDGFWQTFQHAGVTHVTVVTQGRNIASQRLYQRCGFLTKSVELWYHRWFPLVEIV